MTYALYRITAPHYCAGMVVSSSRVHQTAPILAWAIGKLLNDVFARLAKMNYKIELVSVFE